MRPRMSAVVSDASGTQSTAPVASAGTTPSGMKSPNSVIACPPMLARLAVTETRVRVMSNHWNQVPSSPIGLSPMWRYWSATHIGGAHLVDRASFATAHSGRRPSRRRRVGGRPREQRCTRRGARSGARWTGRRAERRSREERRRRAEWWARCACGDDGVLSGTRDARRWPYMATRRRGDKRSRMRRRVSCCTNDPRSMRSLSMGTSRAAVPSRPSSPRALAASRRTLVAPE